MSKVTLTVQKNLATENGVSKAGKAWEQVTILCKTQGEYPRDIVIIAHGQNDVKTAKGFKGGEVITTTLNPESREYQGKWYTKIKIWGLEVEGGKTQPADNDDSSDLPF